jgi:hypothetical protein
VRGGEYPGGRDEQPATDRLAEIAAHSVVPQQDRRERVGALGDLAAADDLGLDTGAGLGGPRRGREEGQDDRGHEEASTGGAQGSSSGEGAPGEPGDRRRTWQVRVAVHRKQDELVPDHEAVAV